MDIKEAYKVMQAEWVKLYDVKVGTEVKLLRGYQDYELGCNCLSVQDPKLFGGIVDKIRNNSIRTNGTIHPFFVLEVVGQPKPKKMTVKEISEMAGCTVEVVE